MSDQSIPVPRPEQHRNTRGQFAGIKTTLPVGTIRIRTRHNRGGVRRAFIKAAEPNTWILRARWVWEQVHGPIPRGMGIHHKDRDTLNDSLDNLELVSKSQHVEEHRPEWEARRIEAVRKANTGRTWSTKSKRPGVRTGRPRAYSDEQMASAIAACLSGESPTAAVARRFGVGRSALYKQLERLRRKEAEGGR